MFCITYFLLTISFRIKKEVYEILQTYKKQEIESLRVFQSDY